MVMFSVAVGGEFQTNQQSEDSGSRVWRGQGLGPGE